MYSLTLFIFINGVFCRDFYIGMFKKNDFLVAQDFMYKERVPNGVMYAKYGRKFDCPVSELIFDKY